MYKLMLKEFRKRAGYTQSEFAALVGMKPRRYAGLEREENDLTLEEACNLAEFLHCTPNDLCGWYESHPEDKPVENVPVLSSEEERLIDDYRICLTADRTNISKTVHLFAEAARGAESKVQGDSRRAV